MFNITQDLFLAVIYLKSFHGQEVCTAVMIPSGHSGRHSLQPALGMNIWNVFHILY